MLPQVQNSFLLMSHFLVVYMTPNFPKQKSSVYTDNGPRVGWGKVQNIVEHKTSIENLGTDTNNDEVGIWGYIKQPKN